MSRSLSPGDSSVLGYHSNNQSASFTALTPERSQPVSRETDRSSAGEFSTFSAIATTPERLQSQQSGSSLFTEYSVTGESPLRPSLRSGSQQSSVESRGVFSVGLTDSSSTSQQPESLPESVPSQAEQSLTDNTPSSEMGSLDLSRAEARSLDLSSGRSSEPGLSQNRNESPRPVSEQVSSMDTDGSLDLSKSAAALSTLQSVPAQAPAGPSGT